jgi:hypothetical protein
MKSRELHHGTEPRARAISRFMKYKPENEEAVHAGEVRKAAVVAAWDAYLALPMPNYPEAMRILHGGHWTQTDIERYCMELEAFQEVEGFGNKAGLFLSALVNSADGDEFSIRTRHAEERIHLLCGNIDGKRVRIDGPVGDYAGLMLKAGSIEIEGSAGDFVGATMSGGAIRVRGNAGHNIGAMMSGGAIFAGNAGKGVGGLMSGGEIWVKSYRSLANDIPGGAIYADGELVCENGALKGDAERSRDASYWRERSKEKTRRLKEEYAKRHQRNL